MPMTAHRRHLQPRRRGLHRPPPQRPTRDQL